MFQVDAGQLRHFIQESTEQELVNSADLSAWEQYQNYLCNQTNTSKMLSESLKKNQKKIEKEEEDSSMYYDEEDKSNSDSSEDDEADGNDDDDDIIDDVIRPKTEQISKIEKTNSTNVPDDDDDDDYSYSDDDEDADDEEEIKLTDIVKEVKVKEQNKIDGES